MIGFPENGQVAVVFGFPRIDGQVDAYDRDLPRIDGRVAAVIGCSSRESAVRVAVVIGFPGNRRSGDPW